MNGARLVLMAIFIMLVNEPVKSQDWGPVKSQDAPVIFSGAGFSLSCRIWTKIRQTGGDGERAKLQAWLTHVVVGDRFAPITANSDEGLDYAGIFGMTDSFCQDNPDKTLKDVAEMLIEDMDTR